MRRYLALLALAAATGATPSSAQQLLNRTVDVNGVTREYLLYVPASYDGNTAVPILFNFHGGSMTPNGMLQMADMRPLAEADSFLLVYPEGLPESPGGPLIWNSEGPWSNGVDEMGFAEAMIDALATDYSVDQSRAYACGYSNGGNLVWDLACLLGDRFAAVAAVAVAGNMFQWTFDSCTPAQRTAVLTIHGTADGTYNAYNGLPPYTISLAQTNTYWAQVNGAASTPTTVPLGNSTEVSTWAAGPACFGVEHYKVNGGGHDWFGAFGPSDFDANTVIWEFVSQYTLSGQIGCASPSTYCDNLPNSTGQSAAIGWSGSGSVAANDLVLQVSGATFNKPGLFFYGPDTTQTPLGDGYLCITGNIQRLPVVFTDTLGAASYAVDLEHPTLPTNTIQAGETHHFQFWHRDTAGTLANYNLSDALTVPFLP